MDEPFYLWKTETLDTLMSVDQNVVIVYGFDRASR
jgi:hypothetical protein